MIGTKCLHTISVEQDDKWSETSTKDPLQKHCWFHWILFELNLQEIYPEHKWDMQQFPSSHILGAL